MLSDTLSSLPCRVRRDGVAARWVRLALACACIALASPSSAALREGEPGRLEGWEFVAPLPNSERVSPWNTVVLREGGLVDPASLSAAALEVTGTESGPHTGRIRLSTDGRTVIFAPDRPYALGERVFVNYRGGLRTARGVTLAPFGYDFTVATIDPRLQPRPQLEEFTGGPVEAGPDPGPREASPEPADLATTSDACAWPVNLPKYTVPIIDRPDPGAVFISPFTARPTDPGRLMIVDNFGQPLFFRDFPTAAMDFKRQPDGRLTYFCCFPARDHRNHFYALDETYAVVDSFGCGNGYTTDEHELQVLPNGNALVMAYDPQPVAMDRIVPRGDPEAVVVGLIIQEIDRGKDVVFQWRSWDHFSITDVMSPFIPLAGCCIDYAHGNAIEVDDDGNLLISSRNMSEITKIDRATGEIIWRFGRNAKKNQFVIENDPRGFSHQHDVRRLPNGHITVFDNGNHMSPEYSRGLEYELDEVNKVARLVWEYRNTPDTFGMFMGSMQRRENGSTMIGWGWHSKPNLTDLHPDGSKAFELHLPQGMWSYRAFRFPWSGRALVADVERLDFGSVAVGSSAVRDVVVRNETAGPLHLSCAYTTHDQFTIEVPAPLAVPAGGTFTAKVTFRPGGPAVSSGRAYVRAATSGELIAQGFDLAGLGVVNAAPEASGARASVAELWPPDRRMTPVTIEGVTDPDGDPVTIEITGVTHDEDGHGLDCPAAEIVGGVARLRAERAGGGNGRVYRVAFTATDGGGASSQGAVTVCVPHDRGGRAQPCVDDGQSVNALAACGARDRGVTTESAVAPEPALRAVRSEGGSATVAFSIPREGDVDLGLYDLAGRRIVEIDASRRTAGQHSVAWSTGGLSPGVYFYRLRAEGVSLSRPVLIVR
jgi:hypothetical protein